MNKLLIGALFVLICSVVVTGFYFLGGFKQTITTTENFKLSCSSNSECRTQMPWATDVEFDDFWNKVTCDTTGCYTEATVTYEQGVVE